MLVLFSGCRSTGSGNVAAPPLSDEVTAETSSPQPHDEPAMLPQAEVSSSSSAAHDEQPSSAEEEGSTQKEYTVSEETYNATFQEIEEQIREISEIIRNRAYHQWLNYLTPSYTEHYSSPDVLKTLSKSPTLKSARITLRTLEDYFLNVVVPSRSRAALSTIQFLDESHIRAFSLIHNKPVILYNMIRENDIWLITIE